jgi:Glu-tRNA(Gln) amidotransferase subunit E-like FAD-binding protein
MVLIKDGLETGKQVPITAGLEVHQQLDSHKLFCNCPSILRNDEPSEIIKRKLHAARGETGEIDIAAKHEASKDKEFVYYFYDTNCLVELDCEPPHLINEEALKIALQIALFLNCEIVPVAQIMRKTVINGSNTSGFQRTVLIGRNGYVETKYGKVGISSVLLEEDAARALNSKDEEEVNENQKIFKLDRLGLPLVEIATEPDIKSALQAKEVALFIGDILRSCKVRRGIGTIRQDVNISTPGHPRIEIKGFQDVRMFIPVIENEVMRQEENLKLGKDLKSEVRNAKPDGSSDFLRPMPGSARMYPETDLPLLKISREMIDEAKKTLPRLRSEIRGELKNRGLSEEMIGLLDLEKLPVFEALLHLVSDPNFIAKVLLLIPKEIASHEKIENIDEVLTDDVIESVILAVSRNQIKMDDTKHVLTEIAKGKSFDDAIKIERIDSSEVEGEIAKIVKEKVGLSIGAYMGLIMAKFKGKVSGKEVTEILNKLLKK